MRVPYDLNVKNKASIRIRIFTVCLLSLCSITLHSQSSLSLNYLYNGGRKKYTSIVSKELVQHGIGVQSKIRLKNRFYLMPDIAYFFTDYEKIYYGKSFRETKLRYFALNANLAYAIPLAETFSFLPFAGLGYLLEDSWQYLHLRPSSIQPAYSSGGGGVADVLDKQDISSIPCNIGFNMELLLGKNIFVTAGVKYMIDIYDTKYNCFPHINIGIGYSFH